jgi:hypothetical protein
MGHSDAPAPISGQCTYSVTSANTNLANESGDCETFLRAYEQACAELRSNPEAWAEVQEERRAFDGTLMDGLEELSD